MLIDFRQPYLHLVYIQKQHGTFSETNGRSKSYYLNV